MNYIWYSQETGDTNSRVVIPVQNSPESDASDSNTQVIPGGGSTSTEYAQSPPSKTEHRSNSTEDSHYDSIAFDEFFHVSTGNSSFRGSCPSLAAHCGWLWNILDSRKYKISSSYSLSFYIILIHSVILKKMNTISHVPSLELYIACELQIFWKEMF